MYRFLVLVVSAGLLVSCTTDQEAPVEPAVERDDNKQLADISGIEFLSPEQEQTLLSALAAAKAGDNNTHNRDAWLEPDLSGLFDGKDSSELEQWKTFTVRTKPSAGIDSLYVMVNVPFQGLTSVFEIAGGSSPPSNSFCPPEPNDTPSRARRNGWNIHIQACPENLWLVEQTEEGETRAGASIYLLYGIEDNELVIYNSDFVHLSYRYDFLED